MHFIYDVKLLINQCMSDDFGIVLDGITFSSPGSAGRMKYHSIHYQMERYLDQNVTIFRETPFIATLGAYKCQLSQSLDWRAGLLMGRRKSYL